MKKAVFMIVFGLLSWGLLAQNFTIRGVIVDGATEEPLNFANVVLVKDTGDISQNFGGATSDQSGQFVFTSKLNKGFLLISYIGYQPKSLALKTATKSGNVYDFGRISLQADAQTISEIVVVEQKKHFEMHNDKMVMNVDEATSNGSANVFEMLRKVPGVVIDKDENLTLNGQGGVKFQFNGRDMPLPYTELKGILKSTPTENVEKIEVVTNPSSKYEAEGTAGIINIVFSQEQTPGFSGGVNSWTAYSTDWMLNDGFNLNYVSKRWTLTSNFGFGQYSGKNETGVIDSYRWGLDNDTTLQRTLPATQQYTHRNINFDFSADYRINENSSVGATMAYTQFVMPKVNAPVMVTHFMQSPYNVVDSSFTFQPLEHMNDYSLTGSLYYNHKLDTMGGMYTISFDYSNNHARYYDNNISDYFDLLPIEENWLRGYKTLDTNRNDYNTYSLKYDMIKPLNNRMKIELGAKSRLTNVNDDCISHEDDVFDFDRSNNMLYTENVNALYAMFSDQMSKKFSYRVGLRSEYTYTEVEQKANDKRLKNSYIDFFPNLNLSYKINDMDNVSLTYAYRISRPEYSDLNPFELKHNDYNYRAGNSNLRPQYSHSLDFKYAFHYFLFLSASYTYTNDMINDISYLDLNRGVIIQQPYNLGHSENATLGLNTALPLFKQKVLWIIWMQGMYSRTQVDDPRLQIDRNMTSFMTWQSLNIDFFFNTKLSISGFYMTGGNFGLMEMDDQYNFGINLSKEFLQKKLKVSAGVSNLPKHTNHIKIYSGNVFMEMDNTWQRPMYNFSISYNFGKQSNNSDLKRIQSDDMDQRTKGSQSMGGQGQGQSMGL